MHVAFEGKVPGKVHDGEDSGSDAADGQDGGLFPVGDKEEDAGEIPGGSGGSQQVIMVEDKGNDGKNECVLHGNSFLFHKALEIAVAVKPLEMVLGGGLGFYGLRIQFYGFLQVFQSIRLIPLVCVAGGNAIPGPGILRVPVQYLLEITDGFVIMLSQFLGHGHVKKGLYVAWIDGKGLVNGFDAFLRGYVEGLDNPLQGQGLVVFAVLFQRPVGQLQGGKAVSLSIGGDSLDIQVFRLFRNGMNLRGRGSGRRRLGITFA